MCEWYRFVQTSPKLRDFAQDYSACVVGSSIICIDLIVQRVPSKRDFRIQDSDVFLSASLSLSFGVMVGVSFLRWLTLSLTKFVIIAFLLFVQHVALLESLSYRWWTVAFSSCVYGHWMFYWRCGGNSDHFTYHASLHSFSRGRL